MNMVRLVGVLALLVVVVALLLVIVSRQFEPLPSGQKLPGGFSKRGAAMQFVQTTADVDAVLGTDKSLNSAIMHRVLGIDFWFIGLYALLYASISRLLMKRNCPWARYLGFIALVAGLGAAVADVRENMSILQLLGETPYQQTTVNMINDAALLKWTLTFVAIALLAIAFQDLESRLAHWISISFIVAAAVGFVGLWSHPLLALAFIPLAIGNLLLAFTAFTRPHELIPNT
ncbi:MAG TPA: hypothetical protein VFS90_08300 [Pyrinomonadaceae bacterium]|nr:hypothetical protein [Pyrinomonadaceae bacterium]